MDIASVFNIGCYKWWLLIPTIFVMIYITISFVTLGHVSANDFRFMIIIAIGGFLGEIINKSKGFFNSLKAWISVGIYQGILFFIYGIGVYIVDKSFTNYGTNENVFTQVLFSSWVILGFTVFYLLPVNMIGGCIGFICYKFIRNN